MCIVEIREYYIIAPREKEIVLLLHFSVDAATDRDHEHDRVTYIWMHGVNKVNRITLHGVKRESPHCAILSLITLRQHEL